MEGMCMINPFLTMLPIIMANQRRADQLRNETGSEKNKNTKPDRENTIYDFEPETLETYSLSEGPIVRIHFNNEEDTR